MLKTVLLLLTVFFSGSHQQCFSSNDNVNAPTLKEYSTWVTSAQNFSIILLKALNKAKQYSDLLFSPPSIREALLLAYFGAAKQTEASLATALQIPDGQTKPLTWKIYYAEKLLDLRSQTKNYPLKNVNKLYFTKGQRLRRCMREKFRSELDSIDITTDAENAKSKINAWVEKETDGDIKNFLKYLNRYTTSALVNAVTFKAKWMDGFDPNNTQTLRFMTSRKLFMVKKDTFDKGYSEELGAQLLLLLHDGGRTGLIAVLPDKNDLDTVIQNLDLTTLGFITNKQNYKPSYLKLIIPQLGGNKIVHLETALERLGIVDAFTANADFSGFTGKKDVLITEVAHEAALNMDEEGSKVVAGSGVAIERRSGLGTTEPFILDRPFLYIVYDFDIKKVLLMGTLRDK